MKLLIINTGYLGDSVLAASFAENCKLYGYNRVDLLIGFPQTYQLIKDSFNIDNVYLSKNIGPYPEYTDEMNISIYDNIYKTDLLQFGEKPIDLFNTHFNIDIVKYNFTFNTPQIELPPKNKPRLAFQYDWHLRSYAQNNTPRNPQYIIDSISDKYEVFVIGDDTHYNIDKNTPIDFIKHCAIIKECDLFFGYPGGMHWMAAGVNTPTITTSEVLYYHYINKGEFKGNNFNEFKTQWMVHASKHFNEPHILLKPEVSDEEIINYLLNYNI
jgi:hypothetical protein